MISIRAVIVNVNVMGWGESFMLNVMHVGVDTIVLLCRVPVRLNRLNKLGIFKLKQCLRSRVEPTNT